MTDQPRFNRRHLMLGAAALGAATALPMAPARAALPMQGTLRPGLYRFKLGAVEITAIHDGAIQLDGPHPIFGENVDAAAAADLAAANFLPADRMEIGFTVTLVNTGDKLILIDAGNGAARRPNAGRLLTVLGEVGVAPEAVDIVAITHFHGDHIGGLMEDGKPAFPNASYVIGQKEYDFWSDASLLANEQMKGRAELVQANVVPFAPKARFIKGGDAVVSGIEAVESFGHTPGHLSYHIESEGKRLMVTGDVANHYVMSLQRPDWHVRFDMEKANAVAARKAIFGMIAADRIPFIGYHMPAPSVGYVEPMGEGFRYVAAGYQLNL